MTFSHYCVTGYSLLGNGTNTMVNEDDSCLYIVVRKGNIFLKQK